MMSFLPLTLRTFTRSANLLAASGFTPPATSALAAFNALATASADDLNTGCGDSKIMDFGWDTVTIGLSAFSLFNVNVVSTFVFAPACPLLNGLSVYCSLDTALFRMPRLKRCSIDCCEPRRGDDFTPASASVFPDTRPWFTFSRNAHEARFLFLFTIRESPSLRKLNSVGHVPITSV